jgi:hypothetical protein
MEDSWLNYTLLAAALAENEVSVTSLVPTLIMGVVGNGVSARFSAKTDGTTHGTRGVSCGASMKTKSEQFPGAIRLR